MIRVGDGRTSAGKVWLFLALRDSTANRRLIELTDTRAICTGTAARSDSQSCLYKLMRQRSE